MKKLISMFLAFAMIFSTAYVSFAEEDVIVENEFASAAGLLNAMNITEVDIAEADKPVSRKEFVKALYKLITNADYALENQNESYFSDVFEPEYIPFINAMKDMGIVNGFSDGSFAPNNNITAFEGITLLLRALGHDIIADANNGYPYGYLFAAKKSRYRERRSFECFHHSYQKYDG